MLIKVDRVEAVVNTPDLSSGLADNFAVTFESYLPGGWSPESAQFDLDFADDEVKDIEAFDC